MNLIAFSGYKGSGKSFAADYLVQKHGYTKVKFAGRLKSMMKAFGLTDEHIEGDLKEEPCDLLEGKTPRWAMQTLGTEWGRTCISENLWGNLWEKEVRDLLSQRKRVVVDDCRFDNEVARIRQMSGLVILMEMPGLEVDASHSSESVVSDPDFVIENRLDEDFFCVEKSLDFIIAVAEKQSKSISSSS